MERLKNLFKKIGEKPLISGGNGGAESLSIKDLPRVFRSFFGRIPTGVSDNQKLYIRILSSLIICAVATLLISSTILYFNFEKMALEQVYTDNMINLKQTSRAVSIMAETAFKLASQIYMDINIKKLQYYKSPDIYDIQGAFMQLENYRGANSFIESIYVYNGKNEYFYVTSGIYNSTSIVRESIQSAGVFDDPQIVRIIKNYKNYPPYIPIPRRTVFKTIHNTMNGYTMNYYTFFLYDLSDGALNSAVIVNIYEDWIYGVIDSDETNQGDTFIINNKGVLISNTGNFSMMTSLAQEKYIKTILKTPDSSGYFIANINKVQSLVSYTEPDSFGWRYIRSTPLKTIFSKINSARVNTVLISMGILLCGLFASYIISQRLYVPINQIFTDLKNLEIAKKNSDVAVKQEYLRSIVLGHNKNVLEIDSFKFADLNINLIAEDPFCIVLLKIDNYSDFLLRYSSEDKILLKNAIIDTSTELYRQLCEVEPIDMGNDCIVLILNAPRAKWTFNVNTITELSKKIQASLLEFIKVSLSVTVSTVGESAVFINSLYGQVAEASLHRLFYGHGCIVSSEKISTFKSKEYHYPTNKEKIMVDALMIGDMSEAKNIYREIISETAEHSFDAFNLAISRLIFTINNTLNTIQKNNTLTDNHAVKPLSVISDEMETIAEINRYFFNLFDNTKKSLEKKRSSKHETLIKKIHEIVTKEFSNPGLSVDNIASTLGISTSYMCRIYKEHTLNTILDYIIEVRMNKAKELLLKTKYSVAEVAEKIGFTNSSYFYKAFKKTNGVTPNDFRCSNS